MNYKEALDKANQYNKQLRADDERFSHAVHLQHEEGTTLFFMSAFAMKVDFWIIIFTEHHGVHVYHEEDVQVRQFQMAFNELDTLKV